MSSTRNGSSSLSAAARVERDRRIAEVREHEGLTWPEIGGRFGMDERSARRAYGRFQEGVEAGDVATVDVDRVVHRVVRVHLRALSRAEELIEEAGQSNAGVGLLRVASSVGIGLLDVLSRTGHLADPRNEALQRQVHGELRSVAEDLVRAADEYGVPRAVIDRIVGETEERSDDRVALMAGEAA